jgi:hypothetical protein
MTQPIDEPDDQPWNRPGQIRRDALPHRGASLLLWARGGVLCILVSACFLPAVSLGSLICVVIAVMARNDLAEIAANTRDRSGEAETRKALVTAVIGLVIAIPLGSLGASCCSYGWFLYQISGGMG